jgi:putative ABC transport system permease protein
VRDFRKQRKRIALTLIALGWGTISIMLLLGFGEGLHRQMSTNKKGMGENIVVLWPGSTSMPFKGLPKGRELSFNKDDIDYLKKAVPEIRDVGGENGRWGIEVKHGDNLVSEHVIGVTPNYEDMRNFIPMMGGRMIDLEDMRSRRRVAFLGNSIKDRLFGDEDAVGEMIYIRNMPFTVVGVMQEKMQMGMYSGPDENKVAIPLTTFEAVFGNRFLTNLVYRPRSIDDMESIERKVFEAFGGKYKFNPDDDRALYVWDTVSGAREFNNMMIGIKIFLGIIGGLTLLIAGVGVANIMYVSIKERTREIGIKMAVGARRSYILAQFLLEAFLITFLGGFGGMAISYVLTEAFQRLPIESEVLDFMGRPVISFEIGLVVVAILGIMGLFAGLFPAMKAASVSPVESLRYE